MVKEVSFEADAIDSETVVGKQVGGAVRGLAAKRRSHRDEASEEEWKSIPVLDDVRS